MDSSDRAENKPHAGRASNRLWGSDPVAELLRALEFEYIALTPGASFRGLHDSLVNHLGNTAPEMILCIHEENAVAIAHGYARVTGRPMAVALHSNVGLMHATMAIFNAWCDRIPIVMLGAVGPVDAMRRRPWVDWIHTASDLGALIRPYTKWDDQPGSVQAAMESLLRAERIARTPPQGPVYVCLDAGLQEQALDVPVELPPIERFPAAAPGVPDPESVAATAAALSASRRTVIMAGRVSADLEDWDRRVRLAERLNAIVVTDLKTGASFPTTHALHPYPPGLYLSEEAYPAIRAADVILSLDWIDLGGTLRQACGGRWPDATVVHCSPDQYVHNGFSMDYQALPAAEIALLASPDRLVSALLGAVQPHASPAPPPPRAAPDVDDREPEADGEMSVAAMAETILEGLRGHNPSYIRLPLGWPGARCRFEHPLDYIGYDGGGGIGSGPGMAVGAAIALRGGDRLPVAVLGDGDYLMGVTAIWSAVNMGVPLLIVVANNRSFFNDQLHQQRMARQRGRPLANSGIGVELTNPVTNLATLAEGQGARGFGPVRTRGELAKALEAALAAVSAGATCVVDVHVAPEYARATSSAVVRAAPGEG